MPSLDLDILRTDARQLGLTDGEIAAVQVTSRAQAMPMALAAELEQALALADATSMGIAAGPASSCKNAPERMTAVVVVSRRLLRLAPVPVHKPIHTRVMLTGTMVPPLRESTRVTASVRCPSGQVISEPLIVDHGHFMGAVAVGPRAGVLEVELLLDRGQGPEVAATFPILVGNSHGDPMPGPQPLPKHLAPTARPKRPATEADLLALVWGFRASHELPLPEVNLALMAVARGHACDMAHNHFFAHVSPTTGDVTKRLAQAHEPYAHVVENIAVDRDIAQAFAQWQTSPGHLRNLLDPNVGQVGVGLCQANSVDDDNPLFTVLVMTRQHGQKTG